MKGISPLVATILLIAFTIAVGGIVSVWITGFTRTQTVQVSSVAEDQLRCFSSAISVRVTPNITGNTTVTIGYDAGRVNLYNPTAYVICGGITLSNSINTTFIPGQQLSLLVDTANCTTSISSVRAALTCIGISSGTNYTVIGECRTGQDCGI
jgi:flagellin-like protein